MQNKSETVVGACLKKHPRESFYLAIKFPGHMLAENYDPAEIFEQLKKCQVEYFDFYLQYNVYENSVHVYEDPRWDIVDYFIEQKKRGRIKHLGFSGHADLPCLTEFLDRYGSEMEFCQLQFNFLDWTMQHGKEKYELLQQRCIPCGSWGRYGYRRITAELRKRTFSVNHKTVQRLMKELGLPCQDEEVSLQTGTDRISGLLQQPQDQGKTKGLAACNSQTASPLGCLNNFYFEILSNFLGSLHVKHVPCFLFPTVSRETQKSFNSENFLLKPTSVVLYYIIMTTDTERE